MLDCGRCGYKNDPAAKFCAACGAPNRPSPGGPPAPGLGGGMPPMPAIGGGPSAPPNWGAPVAAQAGGPAWPPMGGGQPAAPAWPPKGPPMGQMGQTPPPWQPGGPMGNPPPVGAGSVAGMPVASPPPIVAPLIPPALVGGGGGAGAYGAPGGPPSAYGPPLAPPGGGVPAMYGPPPGGVAPTAASAVIPTLDPDLISPDAPRILAGFLVSFEGDERGMFWPLRQGVCMVGRKESGEAIEIAIDHPTTSSRHARLFVGARPSRIKVEDLTSTNGTYVNNRRLESSQRLPLGHGDVVRFGGISLTVILV